MKLGRERGKESWQCAKNGWDVTVEIDKDFSAREKLDMWIQKRKVGGDIGFEKYGRYE